jgi:hypothetical protein
VFTVVKAGEPTQVDVEITNDGKLFLNLEFHVYICGGFIECFETARVNLCLLKTEILF